MIGQVIDGRYRVIRPLGSGGMGVVFEAVHVATDRAVAVKILSSPELAQHPAVRQRFQREAKAAGAVDTQHIVQVLDAGIAPDTGHPYMVMELLRGEDLAHLLKRIGALPEDTALRIAAQACIGLKKAHEAGVVHRDVKPANLFLARRDEDEIVVKVLDFGIAKMMLEIQDSESAGLTHTGAVLGTPYYMSPEQAQGLKTVDDRTDIWSLGGVLYQALSGRRPYEGLGTVGQIILAVCTRVPAPIREVSPWVSPAAAGIVDRAMVLDPEARFSSAEEMLAALRAILPGGLSLREEMLRGRVLDSPVDERAMASCAAQTPSLREAPSPPPAPSPCAAPSPRLPPDGPLSPSSTVLSAVTPDVPSPAAGAATPAPSPPVPWGSRPSPPVVPWASGVEPRGDAARRRPKALVLIAAMLGIGALLAGGAWIAKPQGGAAKGPEGSESSGPGQDAGARVLSVGVGVLPADATVLVDGKPVAKQGNGIVLSGPQGSVHRVRVEAGGRHIEAHVVLVSESKAEPSIVELLPEAPSPALGSGSTVASAPPSPSASVMGPGPGASPGSAPILPAASIAPPPPTGARAPTARAAPAFGSAAAGPPASAAPPPAGAAPKPPASAGAPPVDAPSLNKRFE